MTGIQSTSRPAVPAKPDGPTVYRLTVHARAVKQPALEYDLLPDLLDQTPGNAATLYLLAFTQLAQIPASTYKLPEGQSAPSGEDDKTSLYLELPPEQLVARREEVETFLHNFEPLFRGAEAAAWREECHWDLPIREQGFELLLPHLNGARQLVNLLAIRARLQIATGDWAGAHRTLQTGFALGRHLNQQGLLVQELVGTGIGSVMMVHGVREWQQRLDSPNLYWALSGLPRPYTDFRGAMRWERAALAFTFPQLKKLRGGGSGGFTEQDWQDFQARLNRYVNQWGGPPSNALGNNGFGSVALGIVLYPQAKKHLVEWGWEPRKVQSMPVGEVLAEYEFGDYQRWFDEMMKWANLPFRQAYEGMERAESELRAAETTGVANPLLSFVPAVRHAYWSVTRLDRDIAAAQTIEALRAYAAGHNGKAPDRLQDMIETPAPPDPVTGQDFEYRIDRGADGADRAGEAHVTINCPAPPGQRPKDAIRYEVTIVQP